MDQKKRRIVIFHFAVVDDTSLGKLVLLLDSTDFLQAFFVFVIPVQVVIPVATERNAGNPDQ